MIYSYNGESNNPKVLRLMHLCVATKEIWDSMERIEADEAREGEYNEAVIEWNLMNYIWTD